MDEKGRLEMPEDLKGNSFRSRIHADEAAGKYPSNSKGQQAPKPEIMSQPKRVGKVITGGIRRRKKNFLDKFVEAFFGDTTQNVISYVIWDVLIPATKNTIFDMGRNGLERLLFGDDSRGPNLLRRDRDRTYVNYGGISTRERDRYDRGRDTTQMRSRHDFEAIIFKRKADAEDVLENLVNQIELYNEATVATFYELIGQTQEYTDENWGWKNLSRAFIEPKHGGWVLMLPRPEQLD